MPSPLEYLKAPLAAVTSVLLRRKLVKARKREYKEELKERKARAKADRERKSEGGSKADREIKPEAERQGKLLSEVEQRASDARKAAEEQERMLRRWKWGKEDRNI